MMEGVICKTTGAHHHVWVNDTVITCRLRGVFRMENWKENNPVVVGDRVRISIENSEGIIEEILPRKNHLIRQSIKKTGHQQALAANVDLVVILATLRLPRTSLGFIDRLTVTAEAYQIPQLIVLNKTDLWNEEDEQTYREWQAIYNTANVPIIAVSALQKDSLDEIKNYLAGKISLFAGHSGVGKSTLFNQLQDKYRQAIGDVSSFSQKGTHTTTFTEMFAIAPSTYIIDSPGIKEWGLIDMEAAELSDYFSEMREQRLACKFGARCTHVQEPSCAILSQRGKTISESRYQNYLQMLQTLSETKRYR